jgi:lycopene cyclase domain-containing protein
VETYGYAVMLSFTVLASFWLEIVFKVRVLARFRRAFAAILPVALVFLVWVFYAVERGHWRYDIDQTFGITGPLGIPLEEFLFFLIVPIAAIMTIEAVRRVKRHWLVGDEESGR